MEKSYMPRTAIVDIDNICQFCGPLYERLREVDRLCANLTEVLSHILDS